MTTQACNTTTSTTTPPASCSDAGNCTSTGNTTTAASSNVAFLSSYYFDQNTSQWVTLAGSTLPGSTVTIPSYIGQVNTPIAGAMQQVTPANTQFSAGTCANSAASSSCNLIPYIEILPSGSSTYVYSLVKKDQTGKTLYQKIDQVPTVSGRYLIPLVNDAFSGNLFTAAATVGTTYTFVISFSAQNKGITSGQISTITINSTLTVPNFDFSVNYSNDFINFKLSNRWQSYYKNGSPNKDLPFFTLVQRNPQTSAVPINVQVQFSSQPKVTVTEDIFYELPFDTTKYINTGVFANSRGTKFNHTIVNLDSVKDFQLFLTSASLPATQVTAINYTVDNVPAGSDWDIGFHLNLTANTSYSVTHDPNSKGLLYPLKPECNNISGAAYSPWATEAVKDAGLLQTPPSYLAICDKGSVQTKTYTGSSALSAYDFNGNLEVGTDTWYRSFSYRPFNQISTNVIDVGHFFGIKYITFALNTCMQVSVAPAGSSNYVTKTSASAVCGGQVGWVPVSVSKTYTLFDEAASYASVPGLPGLMSSLLNATSSQYVTDPTSFMFVGEKFNLNSAVTPGHFY
jgi:hypothetical protein